MAFSERNNMLEFDGKVSTGNVLSVFFALMVGLSAWASVESQVSANKSAIDDGQDAIQGISVDVAKLQTDVAVLAKDMEHASEDREEIKADVKEILEILRKK